MEENKKDSLFYRVVNSKTSVILYIITLAIFYFGSIAGGMIIAHQVLPFDELMVMCGELINQNLAIFVIYAIFAIMLFFTVLPVIGIFISFLPCVVLSIAIWIIYILGVAITGIGKTNEL